MIDGRTIKMRINVSATICNGSCDNDPDCEGCAEEVKESFESIRDFNEWTDESGIQDSSED